MDKNAAYDQAMELVSSNAEAALPLFEAALKREPLRARIHSNFGYALLQVERNDEARAAAARGVELRGSDAYPLLLAARIMNAQKAYAEALSYAEAVWSARANVEPALVAEAVEIAALVLNGRNEWRRALPLVEEALTLAPARATLVCARAITLAMANRWGDAKRELERAMELAPHDADISARREGIEGGFTAVTAMVDTARAAVKGAKTWEPWHDLAVALWSAGDGRGALEAFDRARKLHPDRIYREREGAALLSHWEADCRLAMIRNSIGETTTQKRPAKKPHAKKPAKNRRPRDR